MKLVVTDRAGQTRDVPFETGAKLMHVLRAADLGIRAECDGNCACATCHVYIAPDWFDRVGEPDEEEADMLDEACEPEDNSRLSCQIALTDTHDGMPVQIARDWD